MRLQGKNFRLVTNGQCLDGGCKLRGRDGNEVVLGHLKPQVELSFQDCVGMVRVARPGASKD